MIDLPPIDSDYLLSFLGDMLNTPSPTGYAQRAIRLTEKELRAFPDLILRLTHIDGLLGTTRWLAAYSLSEA